MEYAFWNERWLAGQLGFHQTETNPWLERYMPELLEDGRAHHVLVPLCGKSKDLLWLADRAGRVTGVEFVEQALRDFLSENDRSYRRLSAEDFGDAAPGPASGRESGRSMAAGAIVYESDNLRLFAHDFLALRPEDAGQPDRFFDRAALIALPPVRRPGYARKLAELLAPDAKGLLVTLEYDQDAMSGPPFSIPRNLVDEYFGERFRITERDSLDREAGAERLRERGLKRLREVCYQLEAR